MKRSGRTLPSLCLLLAAVLVSGALPHLALGAPASSGSSPAPTALSVSVVPPQLPADGGYYPAVVVYLEGPGGTSPALNDTVVFLTTSQAGVGAVSSNVTVYRGTSFAVASFTTSLTPGTTTVSATSPGLTTGSAKLTTVTPSGFPSRLNVVPVPGTQLVGDTNPGVVLVEALDSQGSPAAASSPMSVTLSSSNNAVVTLPSSTVTVENGSVIATSSYLAGSSPGTATVTASASGFVSGSALVTVHGASPSGLKAFAQPDPVAVGTTGRLVVALTDSSGNPVPAPSPVVVTIASSNTTAVSADLTATIARGDVYSVASYTSGPTPGRANLTFTSPGLNSASALVAVSNPAAATRLSLEVAPDLVPADARLYSSIAVVLTDSAGNPAVASSPTQVTLTASDSTVGDVNQSVVIPPGSSYAVASFASTYSVGKASITATSQNLQSASASVATYGPKPVKVVLSPVFSKLPADGGNYPALEVSIEDASGLPAEAPVDTVVQLTSSSTAIAAVGPSVVVPAGRSFALVSVSTSVSSGSADFTATASGYAPSSSRLTTVSPAPSQLGVYIAPSKAVPSLGGSGDAMLAVQLQDSNSAPARARQDTRVVVTSSNSSVIPAPILLEMAQGADFAWAEVRTSSPGATVLTASSNGLSASSADLTVVSLPATLTLTSSAPAIDALGAAKVQLLLEANGVPVPGANVSMTASSGTMLTGSGVTDSDGVFSDTFIPASAGTATITAVAHDPLVGSQTASTTIVVTAGATPAGRGGTAGGLGFAGTLLPVAIVAAVVVVIVLGARHTLNSRRKDAEEVEETPEPRASYLAPSRLINRREGFLPGWTSGRRSF